MPLLDDARLVLIHPWDGAREDEWRPWLAARDFGQLIASGRDRDLPAGWGGTDVPTSYYASVQLVCTAVVLDDPATKAALLSRQLAHFEPPDGRAEVSETVEADRRLLPGIRGLELSVWDVRAKFN